MTDSSYGFNYYEVLALIDCQQHRYIIDIELGERMQLAGL